jgi:hypothetical protein
MTTIPREETDHETEGALAIEATEDEAEIEVEIITQDAMTLVKEIIDVEMSLLSRRSGNEMTADLGRQAETLAMSRERYAPHPNLHGIRVITCCRHLNHLLPQPNLQKSKRPLA